MGIHDIFSKRQKRLRGDLPDTYQYEDLSKQFRVQVIHIMRDVLGDPDQYESQTEKAFESVHSILCREYGEFSLSPKVLREAGYRAAVFQFFLDTADIEQALDVIEVAFLLASELKNDYRFTHYSAPTISSDEAISELNHRFRDHGIGYQYEAGQIVRVDSQYVHQEVIRPTLHLLADKRYKGANEEFLLANDHYRHGRNKECLNECLKALESTLKVICGKRRWVYLPSDTATRLLGIVFERELIPSMLQSEFSSLRASLESGVPSGRNRLSGHGQGEEAIQVPSYLAAYLLHLTGAGILLLVSAETSGAGA